MYIFVLKSQLRLRWDVPKVEPRNRTLPEVAILNPWPCTSPRIRRCHIGNWLTGRILLKCSPSWLRGALTNSGHISAGNVRLRSKLIQVVMVTSDFEYRGLLGAINKILIMPNTRDYSQLRFRRNDIYVWFCWWASYIITMHG